MLGENINKIRLKRKLTIDRLDRFADIPYTSLTKIETEIIKQPLVQSTFKIAKVLSVTVDELMKG